MEQFQYILILLGCAVSVVAVFRRIHLPPILGYLFVGMLVGPGGFAFIPSIQDLSFLAEFGVVFLMFTIGLEFSFARLLTMRRALLGLGGIQVLICTMVAMLGGWYFGLAPKTAFVAAGALALSSTAVVIKQLAEQHELHSVQGRLSISILLFQDLAAVLFLILIPALASKQETALWIPLGFALVKGIGVCVVLSFLGQRLLRPLFHEVAKSHSNELFMMAALMVVLGAAWLTHHLQLSMALGAFLAGLMLGETEFRHQIEIDIRPFRDVLLGLFFITIGALLRIDTLPENGIWVIIILVSLVIFKTLLIMGLARFVGAVSLGKAFRTGLILAQGGEFGFVILTVAINNKLIDPIQSQIVVAAVVLSIVAAPVLIRYNKAIGQFFFKQDKLPPPEEIKDVQLSEHTAELKDHVIICGFGRVGQILARFLEQENIPSVALDLDPMRISSSALAGEHAFFGDARRLEVLAAAGLARARMVVISFADEPAALETLKHIRSLRLDVPVFVRTRNDSNLKTFQEAGATEVVPESLEASLMLASHLLLMLGVPASRILFKIRAIHSDRYRVIQGFFKGTDDPTLLEEADSARMSLHAITVNENAYAIGKTLSEISEPESLSAIKVLTRGITRYPEPDPEMVIQAGDVLVLFATPEALYLLGEKILRGV
jgi:CPA2 family monovalent cation:H+ antiporter-2